MENKCDIFKISTIQNTLNKYIIKYKMIKFHQTKIEIEFNIYYLKLKTGIFFIIKHKKYCSCNQYLLI